MSHDESDNHLITIRGVLVGRAGRQAGRGQPVMRGLELREVCKINYQFEKRYQTHMPDEERGNKIRKAKEKAKEESLKPDINSRCKPVSLSRSLFLLSLMFLISILQKKISPDDDDQRVSEQVPVHSLAGKNDNSAVPLPR